MLNLLKDTKIIRVNNAAAAGQSTITSAIVDCEGFDAAFAVALLNTVTGGCQLGLQLQDNTSNQTGGMANTGTPATYNDAAGESSNKLLVTEVLNICSAAGKRYLQAVLSRAAQNAAVDGILIVLHRSKNRPTALDPSVIAAMLSNAQS